MLQTFASYGKWVEAVSRAGADKVLEEYDAVGYPAFSYGAGRANSKIHGHWNPKRKVGHVYTSGMNFRTARRKFNAKWINKINTNEETVRIEGSKGNIYEVARDGSHCTCPGFKFRNKCKHVTAAKEGKL